MGFFILLFHIILILREIAMNYTPKYHFLKLLEIK